MIYYIWNYPVITLITLIILTNFLRYLMRRPVKQFTKKKCTNILITGGVQGLGKNLAAEFAKRHKAGTINLIIIDIAVNLAPDMIAELEKLMRVRDASKGKYVNFYKCNIADKEEVESVWAKIVKKHGPVHILVNNAARATGKRLDHMSIEQFKLTMDINFNSYVHFTMLFNKQKEI